MSQPSPAGSDDLIRVIHIDDEQIPLQMTKRLLETADEALRVESVSTPEEALVRIREEDFDCVVSDFQMPHLDGIEVARAIREISDIPIILYTGHGSEDVAAKAFAVGIDDYVRKELHPHHYEVLANRIRVVVEKQWAEKLYRDILGGSRDGVIIVDGTTFIYANQAEADLLGVSDPSELIGRDSLDWLVEGDREMARALALRRQGGDDVPSLYEYTVSTSNGDKRVVETSVSLIDYRGKKVSLAFTRDATERRKVDERIQFLGEVLENSPISVLTADERGEILYVNPATERLFGYGKGELAGKNIRILNAEPDADKLQKEIFDTVLGGKVWRGEILNRKKNGETFYINASIYQLTDEKGGLISLVGFHEDISERKRMEEVLEESEERYRGMVMNSNDIIAECDLNDRWTFLSPSVESILGYGPEEMIGRPTVDFMMPQDVESSRIDHEAIVGEGEEVREYEDRYVKKDGGVVTISWNISPLRDDGGEIIGTQGVGRDVTRQQRMEEGQEKYRIRLEALHLVASDLSSATSMREIAEKTLTTLERLFEFQWGTFIIVEGGALKSAFIMGTDYEPMPIRPDEKPGVISRAVGTGKTQLIPDTRLDADYVSGPLRIDRMEFLSELAVPVKSEGAVVAVINVEDDHVGAFSSDEQKLVEVLAEHVASAITRLRQLDREKDARETYRNLLESSRDAVFVITEDGYAYVNQHTVELLGYDSAEELMGADTSKNILPKDRERVRRMIRGRLRGEEYPERYEIELVRKDGSTVEVENRVSLIEFEGKPASLVMTRDISERKKMGEDLQASEQRFRSLVELAPDGIVTLNLLGTITSINTAFTRHTGFGKEEIVGKHFTKVGTIATKDMGKYVKLFASLVMGKIPPFIEFDFRRKDGSLGKGEAVGQIVELEEGKKEILAILRDVSERSRMEEDLRESETRYRSLFDDSPVSLWEEDLSEVKACLDDLRASGVGDLKAYLEEKPDEVARIVSLVKITAVNKATLDLYGARDLEALRRGFASIFTEESQAFFRKELVALSEGETLIEGESTTVTLGGETRHIGLRLFVPPGYEESLEKVIMSVVDITEMKELEATLMGQSRELEARVEERTRELLDAERMAAAGSIAAMVGHDLRGPLQAIMNAVYLIGKSPETLEPGLELIKGSVDRATLMLQEFRGQTREDPLNVVDVDLGALLGRALEEAEKPEGVEASVEADGVEEASLDVPKIRRVLDNLIRNAVEAMPNGGALRVTGSRLEGGVVIEVSDTGEGIREEVMEGLFKPFQTTKPGGLGLGLAYCKRAVEAHGGSISVESKVGVGTTFKIRLPSA